MLEAGSSAWTAGTPNPGRLGSSPALSVDLELWGARVPRVPELHRRGWGLSCPWSQAPSTAACGWPGTHGQQPAVALCSDQPVPSPAAPESCRMGLGWGGRG